MVLVVYKPTTRSANENKELGTTVPRKAFFEIGREVPKRETNVRRRAKKMAPAAPVAGCWPSIPFPAPLVTLLLLVAAATRPGVALTEQYPTLSLLRQQPGHGGRGCPELPAADWGGEQYVAAGGDCGESWKEGAWSV